MLDPVDGMLLLELELPHNLRLEHYQYLPEPTLYLKDILTAISRAKDELVEPEGYRRAAQAMREAARGEDEVVAAEKGAGGGERLSGLPVVPGAGSGIGLR